MVWRMWRDSNPRWALARHQIKSLARSPLRSHIRSVCLCCSFCFVLVVGGRGRIRTFCHPVIGRGPRHSDSLPLLMVRPAGIEPAAPAMSIVGTPAGIRTPECRCVGPMPLSAWRRERAGGKFRTCKGPGFKPSASSSSATPASWCPLIDLNDHDRSRRCLKPPRLPIPPRGHWCARRDLNPHGVTRRILSAVRLPVPPRAHGALWWLRSTHLRDTNPVLYRMS